MIPKQCSITVPYIPPERSVKRISVESVQWHIDADDFTMGKRAEIITKLDPMLPSEDVVWFVYSTWGNFSCRCCGSTLVFDGQNGAGTPSLLCKSCGKKMSIWNTYELTIWRYKKMLCAILHYFYGGTVESSSLLYGVGKGALNEMRLCFPSVKYSRDGPLEIVEYDGDKYGVVTIDMIYKGRKGVMLGVCGGLNTTSLGNENTCEGLPEFFDDLDKKVADVDNYVFVMDMRISVAKMILERYGEKAIIVLQNHTIWGDVLVYFYRDGWYTLRLRTDAFAESSQKRDEELLLGVGEIELYEGLKGVRADTSLRDIAENKLRKKIEELIVQLGNAVWDEKGRVDLVMYPKLIKLNSLLKELKRRKIDITYYINTLRMMIGDLVDQYATSINRTVKKKIVNAWSALKILKEDVNRLSEALLKEPLSSKDKGAKQKEAEKPQIKEESLVKFLTKPKLIYRGRMNGPLVPEQALWILALLKLIFDGKEITTNPCEGRFGVIGMMLRQGRSIYLERAVTKVHLQKQDIKTTIMWLVEQYPIKDIGKRGMRGDRKRLEIGGRYLITYVNRRGEKTERVIDVLDRKKKYIIAYCHTRQETLTFKRCRIKSIA